ncbi:type I-D CRISPR-associated protein Cas10d/Csc3 [Clostridium sp. A1-XYC3]|uniref:Type I-D CRISPR-associated protein Cas10d/Csc3 n=1 Tax=Clostridium tanneri TaxID=3037988 RepID=A0ABU4JTH0_9CLOT|nr:type I-D CRISPR-associated protein Cas10d/Csc3 [Clostridium sp. A1-XYC3]MDW8801445.1 type I-D CRISPR-associated protein Cas10d/Csc3 [Clostridium sp. A1-XYC3]
MLRLHLSSLKEVNVFNDYYEKIVDKNLKEYKKIIQYGMKKNQTLYSHVLNMIGVLDELKDILKLSNLELKVLMVAVTVHDLNKQEEHSGKGYLRIISEEDNKGQYKNIISECEKLNIEDFFPEYQDYIEDIRAIIGGHSAHTSSFGESLFCNPNIYKLGNERIDILIYIIRALDVIDLSKSMEEKEKKRQFLFNLNNAAKYIGKQYKMVTHVVSEDRGILTNLCHNAVVEFLKKKGFIAVAYYKEGVLYLVEDKELEFTEMDRDDLLKSCVKSIKSKVYDDFKVYIKNTQSGIRADEKCLDMTSIEDIIYEVKIRCNKSKLPDINKKNNIIETIIEQHKEMYLEGKIVELNTVISKLKADIEITKDKKLMKSLNKTLKENEAILKQQRVCKYILDIYESKRYFIEFNEDKLRFSEFVRAFYTFINMHICNSNTLLSWRKVYEFSNLKEEDIEYLDIFEGLYIRPYVLGQMIYDKYKDKEEELLEKIIDYLQNELSNKEVKNEEGMWADLKDYFDKNIILSFDNNLTAKLKKQNLLELYKQRKGSQCCLCSSSYQTSNWMAVDVPYKLKIQNFSNKVNAGTREPKRNICSVCNIEYLLHKVTYASKVEVSRRYLSILPRNFNTRAYIRAFRESINELKNKEISAIYFNDYNTFVAQANKNIEEIEPLFSEAKVNGVAIPNYAETLTNYFILPVHLVKSENDTSKWISSLLYALTFNIYFDSKIIISEFPVPILNKDEIEEIYIGDVPIIFKNLFEKIWTKEEVLKTIRLFINLFSVAKTLGETTNFVYDGLKALSKGSINFIYYLYTELKNKYDNPNLKIKDTKNFIEETLNYIEEGENIVSAIKELAIFANENYIRGSITGGLIKDNAINKPLNIIIDILCRWDKNIYSEEDIRGLCKREMQKYFERVDPYYGDKKIKAIEKYVDFFIDKILNETLGGKTFNLENEKKNILSTYSYYYRSGMGKSNKNGSEN